MDSPVPMKSNRAGRKGETSRGIAATVAENRKMEKLVTPTGIEPVSRP